MPATQPARQLNHDHDDPVPLALVTFCAQGHGGAARASQLERVKLQAVNISPVSGDPQLNQDNPIGKIPALRLDDGTVLHDSRVICEYLDLQHVGLPLLPREGSARWRRMTLVSQADAIMDAAVSSRYESFLRPEDKRWDGWLQAQSDKIRRSLANLEQEHLPS